MGRRRVRHRLLERRPRGKHVRRLRQVHVPGRRVRIRVGREAVWLAAGIGAGRLAQQRSADTVGLAGRARPVPGDVDVPRCRHRQVRQHVRAGAFRILVDLDRSAPRLAMIGRDLEVDVVRIRVGILVVGRAVEQRVVIAFRVDRERAEDVRVVRRLAARRVRGKHLVRRPGQPSVGRVRQVVVVQRPKRRVLQVLGRGRARVQEVERGVRRVDHQRARRDRVLGAVRHRRICSERLDAGGERVAPVVRGTDNRRLSDEVVVRDVHILAGCGQPGPVILRSRLRPGVERFPLICGDLDRSRADVQIGGEQISIRVDGNVVVSTAQ